MCGQWLVTHLSKCGTESNGFIHVSSYSCRSVCKVVQSCVPTTGRFDKHFSLVDACHVMGTVHLHKY
jgi:hypothetical protein